ncbi:sigma-70 family RNA polymerase sigma factor [Lactococcus formosensis]|nr:sigma factor-like helix-turn-helix DNA-binding protein [Lactococcus formosensis]MDG6126724.1 sigma-70 family RNA polymerase sigma factor [Lactococcus formosensis]MDG6132969.1 sigma-70 family RNA polymerase sigma factor [Lactococcus formosensis]MDG6135074.1 sigma-70 family RNA polymerase sigma factor [Lactococcus formosensis]MDG6141143.1 sigma-70 family RNA polymerase sigma factor [Lactococcus formosensis]MDG6148032.1 sigma-70 family RNA polymerase sigma factor [Lactococcus formosensis]
MLGILEESTSRAEKFGERFGSNDTNIKKNRRTIDKLDDIFNPLTEQVRDLIRLRFVDELEIEDIAEQTGLTYNKVYNLCEDPIRAVKKLAKEHYKK